ncbi:type VII secretion protein EccB [Actinoplanes tereljensis]|uniref:Type VII secretion protein EccB n=1 Tax=Paractinoplanes tereljensis TaxID=571912 RepID=A0A919TVP5_9ACTN|nr:type VII secretion protein EccB [Actinoplanes tereljensis]GIF25053.1 type VII secretion protein EccB [Actinoplanes tereljensis]
MPSRQDQLHSYQYSLQRVVAALVTHDPDPSRSPLRRAGTTALVSLLIASLAVVGATIYGVLTGQSNVNPKDASVVFQEKGSGARYVYLKSDDKLHPVLNYTSGLLLAEGETPKLKSIAADKLATVGLGPTLGIPEAPDSLPDADALLTERWSICTDNKGEEGRPRSTLLIGDKLTDGTTGTGEALLVRDPDGQNFMIYNNRRFFVPADRLTATKRILNWGAQESWQVSTAWLNAVPRGVDLLPPPIPNSGDDSVVGDLKVGRLVTGPDKQVAIILADGAADLTPMQGKLMQVAGAGAPIDLGNDFLTMPASKTRLSDTNDPNGLPAEVPKLRDANPSQVCITLPADPKSGDGIRIDPTVPAGFAVDSNGAAPGTVLADFVHVARGKGVVAEGVASATAPAGSGTVSVVTDTGRIYPLASRELLTKLGYAGVKPRQVPSELISLLPQGASLDPAKAGQSQS